MTRSLIGYNVHSALTYGRGYSAGEQARMWGHFERLQPASLLILDHFDWAKEAKRRLPNTIVVFRQYQSNDGRFFMNMTAQQFYDSHARIGDAGLVVSVMNEPTGYGEQNKPEDLENIARFMAQVMDLHGRAGHSIVGPEFGVGHPDLNRLTELDEMWQAFVRWPQHYYGAHEYGTYRGMQHTDETHTRDVYPHRVGRYKTILAYCRTKYAYELPILINEWGIDSSFYAGDDTNKRGWRDAGNLTDLEYAKQLIRCAKEVYTEPNVRGLNIFAHGNTGKQFTAEDWKTHDVSFLSVFMVALEDYAKESPMYPQLPSPVDNRWKAGYAQTKVAEANLRPFPIVDDLQDVVTIKNGDEISIIPDYNFQGWLQVKRNGLVGWVNSSVLVFVEKKPPPPPEPPTPPVDVQEDIDVLNILIREAEDEKSKINHELVKVDTRLRLLEGVRDDLLRVLGNEEKTAA